LKEDHSRREKIMSVDVSPAALLAGFRSWLAAERGLSRETVRCYSHQAGTFLASLPDPVESAVRQLDSGQVTSFMVGYCRDRNVESAKAMATSLRALLRFLHVSGHTPIGLAGAVPGVAGWRLASLPRGVDAAVVAQLLGSCDQATAIGRRDYAILIMLVRLGLRGAEAADLRLGDLDWRAGEVTVRGKGHRIDRLPMPSDVGEAIVAYLTDGRPDCETRTVFATVRKPYRRLTAAAIRGIMGQACRRAGLPRVGAHRLRHTLATDMLRAGASLPQVGQVLRHRSDLSTAIYAKVDENALRPLARPWPTAAVWS
jgi:integrase/recombinase XerD